MREQRLHIEKAPCGGYQQAPYYSGDHTLAIKNDRRYKPYLAGGAKDSDEALPIPVPLHGLQAAPSCRHEDRVLTLEDSAEFFDLVFQAGTNERTMQALVSFIRTL
jgi:hypothetical protein